MKNAVLTIHTNNSGEINETSTTKKAKEELEKLRKAADDIDKDYSPYKAVVSVLMLREDSDDLLKIKHLTTWCADINKVQSDYSYTPVYVKQEKWDEVKKDLTTFQDVLALFKITI